MGGGAFAKAAAEGQPTLTTRRMSSSEYRLLKIKTIPRLQDYFSGCAVSSLIEAPEKPDYGDIDFIIATDQLVNNLDLAKRLGARGVICHSSNDGKYQSCNLAVPIDGSKSEQPTVWYKTSNKPSAHTTKEVFAQIDVAIIPPELFDWHLFYSSYGDMAGLLGKFVHYWGFTVTDKGLLLRLEELDEAKDTEYLTISDTSGKLFLSRDPDMVMRFLGLCPKKFHEGFTTMNQFYEWLGECRLLSQHTVRYGRRRPHEQNREEKRPIYANFLYEWLPAHFGLDPNDSEASGAEEPDATARRRQLRDQALKVFGKQEEFTRMHSALTRFIGNQTAVHLLKPILIKHSGLKANKLTEPLRAFRRWVVFTNGRPQVASSPHSDEESQLYLWLGANGKSLENQEGTSEWVKEHWLELRGLERRKDKREVPPSA